MPANVIPSDQTSTLDIVRSLSTLEQQAIVRPNNPPPGIGGFLFDIPGDEWVQLTSDITDHYVENNTSIQDQIALQPEQITVKGFVAELVIGSAVPDPNNAPSNPLPTCIPMMPPQTAGSLADQLRDVASSVLTQAGRVSLAGVDPRVAIRGAVQGTANQIIGNVRNRVSSAADSAVRSLFTPESIAALTNPTTTLPTITQNAVNVLKAVVPQKALAIIGALKTLNNPASQALLSSSVTAPADTASSSLLTAYRDKQPTPPNQTRQSAAFLYFYNLWKSRQLFSVETAWGVWNNMAILSFRSDQEESTKDRTEFTIVFKKIRTAQDVTVQVGQLAGRNAMQATSDQPSQNGNAGQKAATPEEEASWLYQWGVRAGGTP